jgi:signal peptidase I
MNMAINIRNNNYPKWMGMIFGILIPGSAHYLSGSKCSGVKLFICISSTWIVGLLVLAVPGRTALVFSVIILLVAMLLWIIMIAQSYRPVPKIKVLGWFIVLAICVLIQIGWQCGVAAFVQPFRVTTGAMMPSIMPGDYILAECITYRFKEPKRGDIVVFSTKGLNYSGVNSDTWYVKRIAGLPWETIHIRSPHLVVNDHIITEPTIFAELSSRSNGFVLANAAVAPDGALLSIEDKVVLGENQYLTLGDNDASLDGRYYGPIMGAQILGRVIRIYWPLTRIWSPIKGA